MVVAVEYISKEESADAETATHGVTGILAVQGAVSYTHLDVYKRQLPSDALESQFLADWNESTNDNERLRVAIDQVASLTDNSALALHSILC